MFIRDQSGSIPHWLKGPCTCGDGLKCVASPWCRCSWRVAKLCSTRSGVVTVAIALWVRGCLGQPATLHVAQGRRGGASVGRPVRLPHLAQCGGRCRHRPPRATWIDDHRTNERREVLDLLQALCEGPPTLHDARGDRTH